ncbi:IS4 family transposase [Methylomarinum sp. Ch1-1]|uniref:IS4 family transposase n=1 Tax=Methylomarinum roseum TaxID=3067653 RepID=A0AAU7NYD0_9GAMM|nr:IS4 family transposase [Methylomarinum sp. Ch1-1]MDP4521917.1 IS4 family transposase [Methylomarinum sp. Ch1-1]
MSDLTKQILIKQIRRFKNSVLQFSHLPFADILTTEALEQIIEQSASSRERIFTPLVTLKAFIFQVLSADGSCRQAVSHLLMERLYQGNAANSIRTGAYCKARKRLPLNPIKLAVETSGKRLHQGAQQTWLWKGHNTLMVDGTTVLMPDTPENQAVFPQQSNQKPGLGFPIIRIVGLISLSVGTVVSYSIGSYQGKGSGETSLFSRLIDKIGPQDLLLADRYYCTWAIIALLMQQGSHILVKNHAQRRPDFRLGKSLGTKDHLVEWNKPKRKPDWISQQDYEALPDTLVIREFSVKGTVYVTTLLDAKRYHPKELAEFYSRRWLIELDFRTIKTHLKMDMLRCKSPEMAQKELAVYLLAYNLIRVSIARAVKGKRQIPRCISFMTTVQVFNEGISQLLTLSGKALKRVVDALLNAIASIPIGQQKRKTQPRAVKRRPKAYPLLTKPRNQACNAINL